MLNYLLYLSNALESVTIVVLTHDTYIILYQMLEINSLFLNNQRPSDDTGIDVENILTHKSYEKELYRSNKKHTNDHGRITCMKTIPMSQLQNKINVNEVQ